MRWVMVVALVGGLTGLLWLSRTGPGPTESGSAELVLPSAEPEAPSDSPSEAPSDSLLVGGNDLEAPLRSVTPPASDPSALAADGLDPDETLGHSSKLAIAPGTCELELRPGGWAPERKEERVLWLLSQGDRLVQSTETTLGSVWSLKSLSPSQYSVRLQGLQAPFLASAQFDFALNTDNSPLRLEVPLETCPCIAGRVLDEQNQPIEGAVLRVPSLAELHAPSGTSWSDANGEFLICSGIGNPLEIEVTVEGYLPFLYRQSVQPGSQQWVDVQLVHERTIGGMVRLPDGAPASEARVFVRSNRLLGASKTESNGTFAVHGIEPNSILLYARVGGESDEDFCGRWSFGAEEDLSSLDLTLQAALEYRGLVVGFDGAAVQNAQVVLTARDNSHVQRMATTDGAGRFLVTGLYPGTYALTVDQHPSIVGRVQLAFGTVSAEQLWQPTLPMEEELRGGGDRGPQVGEAGNRLDW